MTFVSTKDAGKPNPARNLPSHLLRLCPQKTWYAPLLCHLQKNFLMSPDLHAIDQACNKPAPGLTALAIVDPKDLEVQPNWLIKPSISELTFKPGKAAFNFGADRLTGRITDKINASGKPGDFAEYQLEATIKGITETSQWLRAKLLNRRVHIIATDQDGLRTFIPFIRLLSSSDTGGKSTPKQTVFSGSVRLSKIAPFFNGTFDVIGGPFVPPTVDPDGSGVVVVPNTVTDDTFTYTVPAGKLLAYVYLRSDAAQMPSIGLMSGGAELGGPTPLDANQGGVFGSGLLRPTTSTTIYFSGLAGTNLIELWLLG